MSLLKKTGGVCLMPENTNKLKEVTELLSK